MCRTRSSITATARPTSPLIEWGSRAGGGRRHSLAQFARLPVVAATSVAGGDPRACAEPGAASPFTNCERGGWESEEELHAQAGVKGAPLRLRGRQPGAVAVLQVVVEPLSLQARVPADAHPLHGVPLQPQPDTCA